MNVHSEAESDHEFQIAPMVDVVFLLIIFFVLSLRPTEPELAMDLASSPPSSDPMQPLPIELAINPDGTVLFNQQEIAKPDDARLDDLYTKLAEAIRRFGDRQPVILEPSPAALHSRVVQVVDCCATAQVRVLSFAQ